MSDILSLQTPYADGDTVTSTNLNDLVKKATFTSAVVDGATTQLSSGAIIVRDGGITEQKLADGSVSEQKLDTATQDKLLKGLEIEAGTNSEAIIGGTKAGNQRGTFALDIQNKQAATSADFVASGDSAAAYGFANKASGDYSTAIGQRNQAGSSYSAAIGYSNTVSGSGGQKSAAIGYDNTADGDTAIALGANNSVTGSGNSSAVGINNTVSNTESHAFGKDIAISSPYSVEMGIWSGGTTRKTAVKATYNGGVALTCENSASAPSDQSTAGAEDIQQLGRSMFTIQRNGDDFTLYFNDGGTIKSLSLGTVS